MTMDALREAWDHTHHTAILKECVCLCVYMLTQTHSQVITLLRRQSFIQPGQHLGGPCPSLSGGSAECGKC